MGNAVVKLGMAGMDATNDYALVRRNLVVGEENVMIQLVNACAICHGKKGRSVIKTAPHLTESTMSFNERVAIIKYGKTTMPPQKDVLDVKTIEGLAKYIESFKE